MKKYTVAFLAVALIAVGAIFVFAQKADGGKRKFGHRFGHRAGFAKLAEKLDLTDAQKEQIKQITDASKTKVQPLMENMKTIRQQLKAATADGQFDEAQVQALAVQQANVSAQMIVERERTKAQIFQILTPEQQAQAKQLKEQKMERYKNKFKNRGSKEAKDA